MLVSISNLVCWKAISKSEKMFSFSTITQKKNDKLKDFWVTRRKNVKIVHIFW